MHIFKYIVKILVIIGALDLGVMGLTNYDVIGNVFGGMSMPVMTYGMAPRVAFVIIGIAGVLCLICCVKNCCCSNGKKKDKGSGGGCCR